MLDEIFATLIVKGGRLQGAGQAGHVRAEWSGADWEMFAEFELDSHRVEALASRLDSDEVHERDLLFGAPGVESKLGRFLVEHAK